MEPSSLLLICSVVSAAALSFLVYYSAQSLAASARASRKMLKIAEGVGKTLDRWADLHVSVANSYYPIVSEIREHVAALVKLQLDDDDHGKPL